MNCQHIFIRNHMGFLNTKITIYFPDIRINLIEHGEPFMFIVYLYQ